MVGVGEVGEPLRWLKELTCNVCGQGTIIRYSTKGLCASCWMEWKDNPEWLDLIALVTEAENVT